jgi:hypothetical protein
MLVAFGPYATMAFLDRQLIDARLTATNPRYHRVATRRVADLEKWMDAH